MAAVERPTAMLYLVSGDGSSLSDEERWAAAEAAWQVFGERDPREIYDAYQRDVGAGGDAGAKGHLWRRAEAAAVDAVRRRGAPADGLRLEVF
jgi:hypothetical protein